VGRHEVLARQVPGRPPKFGARVREIRRVRGGSVRRRNPDGALRAGRGNTVLLESPDSGALDEGFLRPERRSRT
jgi:hypothetical protein